MEWVDPSLPQRGAAQKVQSNAIRQAFDLRPEGRIEAGTETSDVTTSGATYSTVWESAVHVIRRGRALGLYWTCVRLSVGTGGDVFEYAWQYDLDGAGYTNFSQDQFAADAGGGQRFNSCVFADFDTEAGGEYQFRLRLGRLSGTGTATAVADGRWKIVDEGAVP